MDNFLRLTAGYVRGCLLKLFLSLSFSKKEKKAIACFYKTHLTNSLYGRNWNFHYYHFYGKTNKKSLSDVFLIIRRVCSWIACATIQKSLIVNLSELVQFSCLQLTDTYLPYLRKNEPLLRLFSLDKALSSKTHMQGAVCETGS